MILKDCLYLYGVDYLDEWHIKDYFKSFKDPNAKPLEVVVDVVDTSKEVEMEEEV